MPGEAQRYRWIMIERARRWHCLRGEKVIAFAHWTFDGWDGYVITGKPFPNHQSFVSTIRGDRRLCTVRRYVEYELAAAVEESKEDKNVQP